MSEIIFGIMKGLCRGAAGAAFDSISSWSEPSPPMPEP